AERLVCHHLLGVLFFLTGLATSVFYTLSLHDALPIWRDLAAHAAGARPAWAAARARRDQGGGRGPLLALRRHRLDRDLHPRLSRSEEHTSELQSLAYLVCRLLLEKKNIIYKLYSPVLD